MISNFGKRRAAALIEREDPLVRLAGGDAFHRSSDSKAGIDGTSGDDTIEGTGGDDHINGLGGDDTLNGLGGNDRLDGGTGIDTLRGGTGDDQIIVDNAADVVEELAGEGFDRVYAAADYALAAGVSAEVLSVVDHLATTAIVLTGNDLANTLFGNAGQNTLNGAQGTDSLFGYGGDDVLNGGADDDFLDGGAGRDTMAGGMGDDVYIVDVFSDFGLEQPTDIVIEADGEGFDRVYAINNYVLGAGVRVEVLAATNTLGTTDINLAANEFDNTVFGNFGRNRLVGLAGDDVLIGFGGDDVLFGGDGNDFLDGGTGHNHFSGGAGDDIYIVNTGDTIQELAGDGFDRVYTSTDYALEQLQSTTQVVIEVLSAVDHLSTTRPATESRPAWARSR